MSRTGLAALAVGLVTLIIAAGSGAEAQQGKGMGAMLIDMDPFAAPANTATSLGSNETCARINENDTLDADEDVTADTLVMDVTAHDIPAATALLGYNYSLRYDERALTLQSAIWDDPGVDLMVSAPGSNLFNASDTLPDVNGSNDWLAAVLDIGENTSESGSGVLTRLSISSDAGAPAGAYKLSLAATVHLDSVSAYPPGNVNWDSGDDDPALDGIRDVAEIAINQPCGGPAPPGGTVTVGPTIRATPGPGETEEPTPAPAPGQSPTPAASGSPETTSSPPNATGTPSGPSRTDGAIAGEGGGGSGTGVIVAIVGLAGAAAAAGGGAIWYRRHRSGTGTHGTSGQGQASGGESGGVN